MRVETDGGILLAETRRAVRVLETASPPTFYIPPEDVRIERLRPARQSSWCEWKGRAGYWRPAEGGDGRPVAWSYPSPTRGFESLRDHVAFYPGRVVCTVDGERVRPQPGPFYGGWVTDEIVGPIKGEPGTEGW